MSSILLTCTSSNSWVISTLELLSFDLLAPIIVFFDPIFYDSLAVEVLTLMAALLALNRFLLPPRSWELMLPVEAFGSPYLS